MCMAIVIAVPFGLTYMVGKKKGIGSTAGAGDGAESANDGAAAESAAGGAALDNSLLAFATGRVVPVEEVPDQVFASKALGDGIAVWPQEGCLLAPADGTVSVVMEESLHACGITLDNGMELLFHIGLDTVEMKGSGFEACVKAGDRVHAGDELIRFDREKIKAAGHPDVVIMVVTSMGSAGAVQWERAESVAAGADVIARFQM